VIFPNPTSQVSQANVGGYIDYWDLNVSDAHEVIVLRHWGVGYVGSVDSSLDIFFGEGFRFDEIG
jgi:hypothetical protein